MIVKWTVPEILFALVKLIVARYKHYLILKRKHLSTYTAYRTKSRKTPVAIYNSLMICSQARKKELAENLFDQGLCIFYDRTLVISTQLANAVCAQFNELCVRPTKLCLPSELLIISTTIRPQEQANIH